MKTLAYISEVDSQRAAQAKRYLEFIRVSALSAGIYVLPVGSVDAQKPHAEDEVYYALRGQARMRVGSEDFEVREGAVIFVPALAEHRFYDITEELALLVFFAPAESA